MRSSYQEPTPHEAVRGGDGPSGITIFKVMLGTILILAGLGLGIYLADGVVRIVFGEEDPPLIQRVTQPAVEQLEKEVVAANVQRIELSAETVKAILYGVTFLLMLIPLVIATSLVKGGVHLMRGEANEVIAMLKEKLSQKHP